jgi:hypothetical protein
LDTMLLSSFAVLNFSCLSFGPLFCLFTWELNSHFLRFAKILWVTVRKVPMFVLVYQSS